ncbi:enoyl-CoA hydratase-related protein [Lewinella sp. 4G2]|uniref:enoyl-CoA hydratase-related protein n=1 Tax=Lewinella sp. 4G2 TaxID=1803372 RepID=UPI0007B4C040|nr:enoyl-CoA hydratase-related protein [Lewinella sp. 4G2]OAV45327.1 hypothetical protein A3850_012855 [Lewinella sp. 4G2]
MKVTINDRIARVDFDRAATANSLDLAAWQALEDTFTGLSANDEVNVIVLTGTGKHWCAGMDLVVLHGLAAQAQPVGPETRAKLAGFIAKIQRNITAIAKCDKPVLAAIQGGCIGGGVAIATACDIRYCSADAYFVVKEIDFGIVADIGTLQRLPRIINPGLTTELAMTGRKMGADEGKSVGFVNAVLPDYEELIQHTLSVAKQIAEKDAAAITGIKHQLAYAADHNLENSLEAVAHYSAGVMMRKLS